MSATSKPSHRINENAGRFLARRFRFARPEITGRAGAIRTAL